MKKQLLILTLILSAFACQDEPKVSAPKGSKMITKEEAISKGYTGNEPVCNGQICCAPGGGGYVCWKQNN